MAIDEESNDWKLDNNLLVKIYRMMINEKVWQWPSSRTPLARKEIDNLICSSLFQEINLTEISGIKWTYFRGNIKITSWLSITRTEDDTANRLPVRLVLCTRCLLDKKCTPISRSIEYQLHRRFLSAAKHNAWSQVEVDSRNINRLAPKHLFDAIAAKLT